MTAAPFSGQPTAFAVMESSGLTSYTTGLVKELLDILCALTRPVCQLLLTYKLFLEGLNTMTRPPIVVPLCGEAGAPAALQATLTGASGLRPWLESPEAEENWRSSPGNNLRTWPLAKHREGLTF